MIPRRRVQPTTASVRRLGWRLHHAADETELWLSTAVMAAAVLCVIGSAVTFTHVFVSLPN